MPPRRFPTQPSPLRRFALVREQLFENWWTVNSPHSTPGNPCFLNKIKMLQPTPKSVLGKRDFHIFAVVKIRRSEIPEYVPAAQTPVKKQRLDIFQNRNEHQLRGGVWNIPRLSPGSEVKLSVQFDGLHNHIQSLFEAKAQADRQAAVIRAQAEREAAAVLHAQAEQHAAMLQAKAQAEQEAAKIQAQFEAEERARQEALMLISLFSDYLTKKQAANRRDLMKARPFNIATYSPAYNLIRHYIPGLPHTPASSNTSTSPPNMPHVHASSIPTPHIATAAHEPGSKSTFTTQPNMPNAHVPNNPTMHHQHDPTKTGPRHKSTAVKNEKPASSTPIPPNTNKDNDMSGSKYSSAERPNSRDSGYFSASGSFNDIESALAETHDAFYSDTKPTPVHILQSLFKKDRTLQEHRRKRDAGIIEDDGAENASNNPNVQHGGEEDDGITPDLSSGSEWGSENHFDDPDGYGHAGHGEEDYGEAFRDEGDYDGEDEYPEPDGKEWIKVGNKVYHISELESDTID